MKRHTLLSILVALLFWSCGSSPEETSDLGNTSAPILLVGIDGLEWSVLSPLVEEGKLPNFARLMEIGYFGELETLVPTYSPVIWTSIATGKQMDEHGIRHFARQLPGGKLRLFNSLDRTTKALWNIASDFDKRVNVIGWWMTYPVEDIEGVMVSQTNTIEQIDTRGGKHVWKGTLLKGVEDQVHPSIRQNEMLEILEKVDQDLPQLTRRIFGEFAHPLSMLGQRLWNNGLWAFRADATYLEIALRLADSASRADLTLVYFGGADVVGHRFWRYAHPDLYRHRPNGEDIENFGGVLEDYYVYMDQTLGRLLEAYGPETNVFVVSDHGMKAANIDTRFDSDLPPADVNSGDHQEAPPGVLIASGPGVRKPSRPTELSRAGSVLDIAPTLLVMMDIPVGDDMAGRPLPALVSRDSAKRIATHDTEEFLRNRGGGSGARSEEERLEQLRSLGYIK